MLPLERAAFLAAGNLPSTLNAQSVVSSVASSIVDSSPPAADDDRISGDDLIAAQKRVRERLALRRWSYRRLQGDAPGDAHSVEDAHPTAGEDAHPYAHPDAHPSAAQPDQPASQPESQPVDEPSDDDMNQAWYASLLSGPISLVPSRSAVFDPCAELESNDRPKALYVFPEAQFFRLYKHRGPGLTQLRAWNRQNYVNEEAKFVRAVGICL